MFCLYVACVSLATVGKIHKRIIKIEELVSSPAPNIYGPVGIAPADQNGFPLVVPPLGTRVCISPTVEFFERRPGLREFYRFRAPVDAIGATEKQRS